MSIIQNNSDFLFIYDATLCNPNGDPDQENKPRMDYDTKTNLVTDTRLKRSIRDFLKSEGQDIFVDMEGHNKVSVEKRLLNWIYNFLDSPSFAKIVGSEEDSEIKKQWVILKQKVTITQDINSDFYKELMEILKTLSSKISAERKSFKTYIDSLLPKLNDELLRWFIKNQFIDIRMFGGAFAVAGFTRAYTGSVQINWGYSLHEVDLVDSTTIVTTMNDDNSTFGKDYRVYYSLLAFNGTMNKYAAHQTGLTETDRDAFRNAVWNAVSANPTRSKLNQYPKLYVEFIYNDGFSNGYFGDLRKYVEVRTTIDNVRGLQNLEIDFSKLKLLVEANKGEGKPIKDIFIKKHTDINF